MIAIRYDLTAQADVAWLIEHDYDTFLMLEALAEKWRDGGGGGQVWTYHTK